MVPSRLVTPSRKVGFHKKWNRKIFTRSFQDEMVLADAILVVWSPPPKQKVSPMAPPPNLPSHASVAHQQVRWGRRLSIASGAVPVAGGCSSGGVSDLRHTTPAKWSLLGAG